MSQTKAQLIDAVDGSIVTADIADDAVNADKLASNSVVSASIVDGSIVNADINASAAIAKSKIENLISNNADNRVITGSDTANTLNGEANLTYDGNSFISTQTTSSSDSKVIIRNSNTPATGVLRLEFHHGTGTTEGTNRFRYGFIEGFRQSGSNDGGLAFGTKPSNAGAPAERMRIDSSGRVMIGTTTEGDSTADNLTIADSGSCGITIRSGTSNEGNIFFSDGTSGGAEYAGTIQYNHSSNFLRIDVNASEAIRIDSSGRVGIGVTDPNTTLHIRGSNNGAELEGLRIQNNNTGSGTKTSIGFTNTTQSDYEHGRILCTRDNAGRLDFQVGAQSHTVLCVDGFGSGVVGVNTVQASKALDVNGEIRTSGGLLFGTDTAAANTLNDYEEGTFTPNNTVGMPLTNNFPARYVKIGKMCWISMDITFDSTPSDVSQCGLIQSLPFTSENLTNGEVPLPYFFISENGGTASRDEDESNTVYFIGKNESRVDIFNLSGGHIQTRGFLHGRRMRMNFCYRTA